MVTQTVSERVSIENFGLTLGDVTKIIISTKEG